MKTKKPKQNLRWLVKTKQQPILSTPIIEELQQFLEQHPAERFSLNLRRMLLEFLQHDGAIEAQYLNDLLYDLEAFFEFLHIIQSHKEIEGTVSTENS